ncbi:unnamed protein product [Cercospora beticola]|nr:unnamed protein product [Cercospora beticola]
MCGISCIVTLKGTEPQAKKSLSSQLTASLENIQHRGPDSSGRWVSEDGRVALGHVRLSINDLSDAGIQPMHNTDDTVHVVVNGELYDYDGIRESISKKTSYQFRSHSDSELVVALYQYYGLSFISHLRGEFSICLYDSARQLFIAVRDRYGIKPLFWTIHNGRLLIAAEVKAFLPLGWRPEWDVRSLIEGGWSNDQRTLWKGVQKVNPGEYLICRGLEGLENVKYWDIEYPDKYSVETRSEDEMVEGVRSRLLEAVRLRLRADVPVGIYLSGGIDSTVIAGMLAHLLREVKQNGENEHDCNTESLARMSCFTIAFDEDSGFDESSIAKETAASLNVPLHTKHMSEAELARYFSDAVYHTEHHWGELNFVAKFALSELTREKGYKVVLTGEGADEAFGGYRFYVNDYTREPDHSWLPSLQVMPEPDRQSIHRQQEENY